MFRAAHVALLDSRLTLGLRGRITAGTGMDALTHAIECYTCAYAQGANEEARYKMSMASMLAGMSYGTESAGAVHAMSQTAGGVYNLPHGELTASLLAPVMAYNYMGEPHKYARIAQALGENTWGLSVWEAAELAVEAVARLTGDVGIPEEDIPMLAQLAFDDPQTIGNPRDIDVKGYAKIYQSCFD